MQKKDQTFSKFLEFKALVEKDTGKHLKAIKSDNGGEHISNEFKNFCSKEVIQREIIAPHNPQQNGSQREKTERSWVLHKRYCMTRAY